MSIIKLNKKMTAIRCRSNKKSKTQCIYLNPDPISNPISPKSFTDHRHHNPNSSLLQQYNSHHVSESPSEANR